MPIASAGADERSVAFARQFGAALAQVNEGDLQAASRSCDALRKQAPQDAAVAQLHATIAFRLGALDEAAASAAISLRSRSAHVPTLTLAARIALARGRPDEAMARLREAIACAPTRPELAFLLLRVLLDRSDAALDAAITAALRQFPDCAAEWLSLGLALQRRQRADLALAAFTQAATADPTLAAAELGRGVLLREAGQMQAAHAALSRAVALDTSLANAWFALGLTCQDLKDESAAVAAFRSALAARADFPEAAVNLGIALQRLGCLKDALHAYQTARRLRPETVGRIAQALTTARTGVLCLTTRRLHELLDA